MYTYPDNSIRENLSLIVCVLYLPGITTSNNNNIIDEELNKTVLFILHNTCIAFNNYFFKN